MIEALILWGVVSNNADRRREYMAQNSEEEKIRDNILFFFFFLTVLLWPLNFVVHFIRLAVFFKLWYLSLIGLIPVAIGAYLITGEKYFWYLGVGAVISMFEMVRVGIRNITVS